MPPERRMTEAEIRRKTNKPIMEKKRRERINRCLEDLKSIVLTSVSEESRPNKLEKADILEMTVRYLKSIHTGKQTRHPAEPSKRAHFTGDVERCGYTQCIKDVTAFLINNEIPVKFRTRLLGHLADKCNPAGVSHLARTESDAPSRLPPRRTIAHQFRANVSQHYISELNFLRHDDRHQDMASKSSRARTGLLPTLIQGAPRDNSPVAMLPYAVSASTGTAYSPVPVSLISNGSASLPFVCRPVSSPAPSFASQRSEDWTSDQASISPDPILTTGPGKNMQLASPVSCKTDIKPSHFFGDNRHHHMSSDSGNWSSGSAPPSPAVPAEYKIKHDRKVADLINGATCCVSTAATVSRAEVWRPWGL